MLQALEMSKEVPNVKSICVVNVVQSVLARLCDYRIFTNCGREVAVGATKSLTFQILNMLAIGIQIARNRGQDKSEIVKRVEEELGSINAKIRETLILSLPKCR